MDPTRPGQDQCFPRGSHNACQCTISCDPKPEPCQNPRKGSVRSHFGLCLLTSPAGRGLFVVMLLVQGIQRPHLQHSTCALSRLSSRPQIRRSQNNTAFHRRSRCQATGLDFDALLFDCDGVLCDTEAEGHRVRTICPTSLLSLYRVILELSAVLRWHSTKPFNKKASGHGSSERFNAKLFELPSLWFLHRL